MQADTWSLQPMISKLSKQGILCHNTAPVCLHHYSCIKAMSAPQARHDSAKWAYGMLTKLGALARIMGYLVRSP